MTDVLLVTAEEAGSVTFHCVLARRMLHHLHGNGYSEDEVDEFLDRVTATLEAYEMSGIDAKQGTPEWHEARAAELLSQNQGLPSARAVAQAHAHANLALSLRHARG